MRMDTITTPHRVATHEEWLKARIDLLGAEKELTRMSDELARKRRQLPWVRVEKDYRFATADGEESLGELFRGRSQLLVYHFMFGPDYKAGCPSCSSIADGFNGFWEHLAHHDVMFWAVSRAPIQKLLDYRERMGWSFPWYSSFGTDFNYDFHATLDDRVAPVSLFFRSEAELAAAGTPWTESMRGDEMPGISAFLRVDDEVFHTYSTYGRGIEEFHNGYHYLDLTALGRQEVWEEPTGRAVPLGLQVGGPAMRLPDQYDVEQRGGTARPEES